MQDKEAHMMSEKQAQQGLQQASNVQAGKPKEVQAKKATPKELQQAEVSAVSVGDKTTLSEQGSHKKLMVNPTFPLAEANVKRGGAEGGGGGSGKGRGPSTTHRPSQRSSLSYSLQSFSPRPFAVATVQVSCSCSYITCPSKTRTECWTCPCSTHIELCCMALILFDLMHAKNFFLACMRGLQIHARLLVVADHAIAC